MSAEKSLFGFRSEDEVSIEHEKFLIAKKKRFSTSFQATQHKVDEFFLGVLRE